MSAAPPAPSASARIDALLKVVLEKKASDLHVACGSPPMIRIDGEARDSLEESLDACRKAATNLKEVWLILGPARPVR